MEDEEVVVLVTSMEGDVEQLRDLPSVKTMRAEQLLTSDFFGLASTADPDTEAKLDAFADIAPGDFGNGIQVSEMEQIRREVLEVVPLGDTPATQIAFEALRRYVAARANEPTASRSELREDAVRHVLFALEASRPETGE